MAVVSGGSAFQPAGALKIKAKQSPQSATAHSGRALVAMQE
jgi:hypothetical protein